MSEPMTVNQMKRQISKIALAAALLIAPIGAAPALAQYGLHRLALAKCHQLLRPMANDAKQNYNCGRGPLYSRGIGYQWDPWTHLGSYYGPMIGIP